MSYIQIIITACVVFPILAFFITIPYIVYNYNKYGSILFVRTLLIYGFVLYLLSAYFLIILPLPTFEYVSKLSTHVQLIPFSFISDMVRTVNFDFKDISTYVNIFKNPFVYQAIYNLLLTLPFGLFLRYYFNCNFRKSVLLTFCLSLFFEITQLTGLYFIYPHAYRLFDVDDLIINTLGGIVGYAVTPLFQKILPNKNELDLKSYKKGLKVTSTKRLFTFLIDIVLAIVFMIIEIIIDYITNISLNYYIYIFISLIMFFVIIPLASRGFTLGGKITNIKVTNNKGEKARWYQLLFRNLLFISIYIPFSLYLWLIFKYINKIANNNYSSLIIIGYVAIISLIFLFILIRNFILHKSFMYENITRTKLVSTIDVPTRDII